MNRSVHDEKYYRKHRERILEKNKAYYQKHKEKINARRMERYYQNREIELLTQTVSRDMKFKRDAQAYAKFRKYQRDYQRKRRNGGKHCPHLCIPDWAVKGQVVLDARSPFLRDNVTPSQRAYARELFIERAKKHVK